MQLARLDSLDLGANTPAGAVQIVLDEATVALSIGEVIDIGAETARLEKELSKVEGEIKGIAAKLANENFTSKAPVHVVEEQRERESDAKARAAKIIAALDRLKGVA